MGAEGEMRQYLRQQAKKIESEMRRIGNWVPDPPTEDEVLAGGAFGQGTVPFDTWVQVVFVPRLRQVAAGEIDAPSSSSVGTQAMREWDGDPDKDALVTILSHVDFSISQGRPSY